MKKTYISIILAAVLVLFAFTACQKGATGPVGADGADGAETYFLMEFQDGVLPDSGYTGTQDNYLRNYPSGIYLNYGIFEYIYCGYLHTNTITYRPVIKFDVTGLPAGAVVKKAYLTYHLDYGDGSDTFYLHRLTASWTETGSSWMSRTAADLWTSPGGDFETTASSDGVVISNVVDYYSFNLAPSVVQDWYDNSASNTGVMVYSPTAQTTVRRPTFASSRDTTNIYYRPKLSVYYTLP